ncbi:hypothetical protein WJX73_005845 [Symbiochloris irregularis]|uniref:Glutaredoxin domain-containing protein n=1 Tax=Symbiochloris irregularis TaxID=706552 RepID=A0AAW1PYW5_9CHLO
MLRAFRSVCQQQQQLQSARRSGWSALQELGYSSAADGVHSDFQPKSHIESPKSVDEQIKKDIEDNRVFLYMKGNPAAPQCGFSNTVCKILDAYDVKFASADVLQDEELREGIKKYSEWPTIPQLFVNGEFVGGADILMGMHKEGELEKLFSDPHGKEAGAHHGS